MPPLPNLGDRPRCRPQVQPHHTARSVSFSTASPHRAGSDPGPRERRGEQAQALPPEPADQWAETAVNKQQQVRVGLSRLSREEAKAGCRGLAVGVSSRRWSGKASLRGDVWAETGPVASGKVLQQRCQGRGLRWGLRGTSWERQMLKL